jgi:hypothetical protein
MKREQFYKLIKRDFDFEPDGCIFDGYLDDLIQSEIEAHEAAQWKAFPENKPVNDQIYIFTGPDDDGNNSIGIAFYENEWYSLDGQNVDDSEVITFRELPKPFNPETK